MTTVAAIADTALDAVAAAITDAVHTATLDYDTQAENGFVNFGLVSALGADVEDYGAITATATETDDYGLITGTPVDPYNATTGIWAITTTTLTGGRAVLDTVKPISDVFPSHVKGPKDQLWLLEGFSRVAEGDRLTVKTVEYVVSAVQDLSGAGSLYYAVAQ